jgi:phenylalanyl-tRNA synthetase alpha chain
VLAWGLGLERLAIIVYGVEDIRELYRNDLSWIRSVNPIDLR